MKLDIVKFILALAIALLLGFVCEIIAPEANGRNWISLAIGFISIASVIIPAMGVKYTNSNRGVNIITTSWIWVVVLTISNIVFSCFEYRIETYIVIIALLAIIAWGIIYGIYSAGSGTRQGRN